MTDRELMQQALSVLCNNVQPRDGVRDNRHLTPKSHAAIYQQTIDALLERLAQPEQEPVAWMVYTQDGQSVYVTDNPIDVQDGQRALPLYPTPPQRPWVGLTDEEIQDVMEQAVSKSSELDDFTGDTARLFFKIAEAKLKDKNT